MSKVYRPRLRADRRHPVKRKDNMLFVTCEDAEDAKGIEGLLNEIFKAAAKVDLAFEAVATGNPKKFHPQAMMAEVVPVEDKSGEA